MVKFNPFNKDINELDKDDLQKLIEDEVVEGWYIQFVNVYPESEKEIARSIASFANSYGGWYIIGVTTNEQTHAETIEGFDLLSIDNPKEKLEEIIRDQLRPVPFFDMKLVWVDNNKAVMVVYVEEGSDAPYLTKEGKIFRRAGNQSEPVEETERDTVQKLIERSYDLKERIEAFSNNPFSIVSLKKEEQLGFMEMYFYVLPFDKQKYRDYHSAKFFDDLKEAFSQAPDYVTDPGKNDIVFQNIFTSVNSYVIRHVQQDDKASDYTGLTLELFENGNAKVVIPIPKLPTIFPFVFIPDIFQESELYKVFLDRMSEEDAKVLRIINGFKFFMVFATVFHQYCTLLHNHNFSKGLNVRLRFTDLRGALVFFDDAEYLNLVEKWGYPTCQKERIEIPPFRDGNLIQINAEQDSLYSLLGIVFEALGFSLGMAPENLYGLSNVIQGLSKSTAGKHYA
ncbi:ATP-binding protein [bacterium]|nr:ATP-binding protein [bacterium]